jgi:hypothetical protein
MTDLPLTGGCNCGAVRFEVTEPLVAASYCHCKCCQRRSGAAASPNAHPTPGSFRVLAGEDKLRLWKPQDGGEKWFCGECGSSLFGLNPSHADPIGIRTAHSWPKRRFGGGLNHAEQRALQSEKRLQTTTFRDGWRSCRSSERTPASQRNIASTFAADDGRPRREGHEDRPRFRSAAKHPRTERLDVGDWLLAERKLPFCGGFMELAGLEPATSWVRSRRSPS